MSSPETLDAAGIAARIPHAGAMCLLDGLLGWDEAAVRCRATSHADAANPLRSGGVLPAPAAIEYASQAMALHGALMAGSAGEGAAPRPGFLAAVRAVRLHAPRLDDAPGPITVTATRLAGEGRQAIYRFELADADGRTLVEGRATVVLDTPLPTP